MDARYADTLALFSAEASKQLDPRPLPVEPTSAGAGASKKSVLFFE